MFSTFGVQILTFLLAAPSAHFGTGLPPQANQSQTDQQTSSSVDHSTPTGSKAVPGAKSCPPSASVKPANCTPEPSHKRKPPPPSRTGEAAPPGEPTKTVVRNGGASDTKVAISPGMSEQQASQKLQKTNRLLSSTDANLKQIEPRQLSASQQDTVKQIKNYVDRAKEAASKGDVERAYNLASKANMLSADLVGPQQ